MGANGVDLPVVAPIRVLVANIRGVQFQLIEELIEQQPDMRIVRQVQGQIELLVAIGEGIDVLLLGALRVHPIPGICTHILSEFPELKILVLTSAGSMAMVYWRGLRRHQIRTVSMVTLPMSIRSAYQLNPAQ
jgi:hypothetical protein